MIVYCNTIKKNKRLSKMLNCFVYYHHVNDKEIKLQEFKQKKVSLIVVTNSLRLKLKMSNIRMIIHVNRPRNLLKYTQKSERAKRNELLNKTIIVKIPSWQSHAKDKNNAKDVLMKRLMKEKMRKESKCC